MRYLIIGLCLMFLVGCASTITVSKDGTVTAKDYTVRIDKDGSRTYVPNRWFTSGLLNSFFGGATNAAAVVAPLVVK